MDKVFGMPIKPAPRWKFWLARMFGKTIHKEAGFVFKEWRGAIWACGKGVGV
ncbi:hypothetical protein LCGC14_1368290 [marine sediment metagenome]|uniref:Uncharacterized protein n=1 Tax=marine sediment metagenome TaxID=412755 RepID=A0A0F9K6H5_9ZZZZ